jgi:hypothetical protein
METNPRGREPARPVAAAEQKDSRENDDQFEQENKQIPAVQRDTKARHMQHELCCPGEDQQPSEQRDEEWALRCRHRYLLPPTLPHEGRANHRRCVSPALTGVYCILFTPAQILRAVMLLTLLFATE